MGSEEAIRLGENVNVVVETSVLNQSSQCKKNGKRVPKRIHKAEREKQKREHLNDLFFELSNTLDLKQPNNGKASVLCETARLLKDLFTQIECLRKENSSLLSESHYVLIEKNELTEENSTLETQIGRLQSELEARLAQSKPDLNAPPLDCLAMPGQEPGLSQPHAVFVLPFCSDLQPYPVPKSTPLPMNVSSNVSKPHARYPTSRDSWPPQLLREHPKPGKDLPDDGSVGFCSSRERERERGVENV